MAGKKEVNSKIKQSSEIAENEKNTKDTKRTRNSRNTRSTKDTRNTRNTKNTKDTRNAEITETTEITENTESTENTENTENTKGTTGTESKIKLFDSELKLMELLWANEGATAKELALLAADRTGWNKNTTYTVIKKLVAKGAIERSEPNFVCRSLITREEVGRDEARKVLRSFFGGSVKMLFSSFMADGTLSAEETDELRKLIDEHGRKKR